MNRTPNRPSRTSVRTLAAVMALGCVLTASAPLHAQGTITAPRSGDKKTLSPPVPTPPSKPASHLLGSAMAFLLGALVIGVNFIPSKRGHQD